MTTLTVVHRTIYRYRRAVRFGDHRLMFRPRDSHDLRLLDTKLVIEPAATVRWLHDVFGNSVAIANFDSPADRLVFESSFCVRHYPIEPEEIVVEPEAQRYPFEYPVEELPDLAPCVTPQYPDPDGIVAEWAGQFLKPDGSADTMELLQAMNCRIREEFTYVRRGELGTRPPLRTMELRSGTCRDYALLMMEAVRALGFAARFVTGYLYDASLMGGDSKLVGSGETHAWVQVYLPGAGWVEFDPTNALVAGRNLIRVAVARDPSQAIPLSGTYFGSGEEDLGMEVKVEVTAEPA
ncbi:MAG: transglutaminase family protein [Acetobacteraceae bacterium]|nr:transglutaminase family protein [Acetobacteraceae bacterium]